MLIESLSPLPSLTTKEKIATTLIVTIAIGALTVFILAKTYFLNSSISLFSAKISWVYLGVTAASILSLIFYFIIRKSEVLPKKPLSPRAITPIPEPQNHPKADLLRPTGTKSPTSPRSTPSPSPFGPQKLNLSSTSAFVKINAH